MPVSSQPVSTDSTTVSEYDEVDNVEISLLTCQPHDEVYSLYGHTAIRIVDPQKKLDVVANWGIFDTSKPYFSIRFVFGLTDYMMGVIPTEYFLNEYLSYGSGVYQQCLNLSSKEKESLMQTLDYNYRPENRVYRYNFYFDNCTSRARDAIMSAIQGDVTFVPTQMQRGKRSFRELIHWKNNGYHWAAFGNDLLLGVGSDRNTTMDERQFLPEILMADFDSASVRRDNGVSALVDSAFWVVAPSSNKVDVKASFPLSPLGAGWCFFVVILMVTLLEICKLKRVIRLFDDAMFFLYGLCGIVLFAMVFSEHPTVRVNMQIFLFCPLWLVFAFHNKKWNRLRYYVALTFIVVFFVCNTIQSYAEGMNVLALCLSVRVMSFIFKLPEKASLR